MTERRKNTEFTGLGNLLKGYIRDRSQETRDGLMHVVEIWKTLADRNITENSKPDSLKNGILTIRILSPAWSQQIIFIKKSIISEINSKAEAEIVRDIKCRITGSL